MNIMYPHRLRLRGPWECAPLTEPARAPWRVKMPCRLGAAGLPGFAGRVRFCRAFGNLRRLDEHERVWLTLAGVEGTAEVRLNGQLLGDNLHGAFEFEVTVLLGRRNRLEVIVAVEGDRGALWEEVALEVRATAFLRGVRAYRAGEDLNVDGEVAGCCDRPLELYVLVDRATAAYRTIEAGQAFHVVIPWPDQPPRPETVRVDLVNVAVVWYAVVLPWPG